MSTPWRRRVRRMRRVAVYSVAGMVILAGLVVALASRLLPLVQSHPQQMAAWLSERSGQAVAFRFGNAEWTRRGPLFTLEGLTIGQGEGALDVGRAELLVDVYAGLLPGRPMTELRLRGADVQLQRDAGGAWRLVGIGAGGGSDRLRQLEGLGEIQLENARVQVLDLGSGRSFALDRVDARVRSVGGRVRVGATAWRGSGAPLRIAADLDAGLTHGHAYLGGRDLQLQQWAQGLDWAGVSLHQARGDVGIWLQLHGRAIDSIQLEASLRSLSLQGDEPITQDALAVAPRTGMDALELSARWRVQDRGWELSIPRLGMATGGGSVAGAEGVFIASRLLPRQVDAAERSVLTLQASALELDHPLALAMLSARVPAALRRWLYLASPRGSARDLRVHCSPVAGCSGHAQVQALRWRPAGRKPGLRGLAGRLDFDRDGAVLQLAGDQPLRMDAPHLLRAPIEARVHGRVHALRSESQWEIGSAALAIAGADFAASAAGSLVLEPDAGRPRADVFVEFAPASVTAARQFLVPGRMPAKAVAWLDEALVAGTVTGARAVLRGDLDDWPFRHGSGVFDAVAGFEQLTLDYRPGEWPRGEQLHGQAWFRDGGMQANATGRVAGIAVDRVQAHIATFREPMLDLEIDGEGAGSALLALLRASPLQQRHGDQLLGIAVGGTARVQVDIQLPLKKELGSPAVQGTADLQGADLRDAKWGLAFDGATGRVRFGDGGFAAEELRVRFDGQPATLSIAIGEYASSDALAAEAMLRGRLDIDALLARAPGMDWLAPYASGMSDWSLLLTVPREGSPMARALRARSDLVGTTLSFPAPLRKPPGKAWPLQLHAELPLETGSVDLQMGPLRLQGRFPAVDGFTGTAAFGAVTPAAPSQGLRVAGHVAQLDLAGWLGVAMAGEGSSAGALVRDVDLVAAEFDVLGRLFADTRVQMLDSDGDTRVLLEGPQLHGEIVLPGTEIAARGITARFERLAWPARSAAASERPGAAPAMLPPGFDPALIPPLHLWAGALQFGSAVLGEARLETWPTPEGLHVQSFESRSADMELHASGDWLRVAGQERSSFQISFTAEDLGRMLDALGFAGMVQGGQTLARLDATWPGAPSAFELERVDGRLQVSVGQGSVPNVEPGAGRILGLLSLTEIPRRLALDFSDFFNQGFAFNTIAGSFVLDAGSAYTEDLVIDGASAEIRVRGRTGLRQQTYDQTMEVVPRTSGVLPVVGALAAGPAGAAIGAVAQAVLQRPMQQMTRVLYRVQGSWEEPRIDVIERGAPAGGPAGGPGTGRRRPP